jgi:methylenetetrahydrofolate dehydrogenase (NADP+)/methenyltetrahydrofolate cyclohydrolase
LDSVQAPFEASKRQSDCAYCNLWEKKIPTNPFLYANTWHCCAYKDNQGNSKIVGDVNLESVIDKVKYITKVPGGVGKTTIACLMYNVSKKFI